MYINYICLLITIYGGGNLQCIYIADYLEFWRQAD